MDPAETSSDSSVSSCDARLRTVVQDGLARCDERVGLWQLLDDRLAEEVTSVPFSDRPVDYTARERYRDHCSSLSITRGVLTGEVTGGTTHRALSTRAQEERMDNAQVSCSRVVSSSNGSGVVYPFAETSFDLPLRGRLPQEVVRVLNSAWEAAGRAVPAEPVMLQLGMQFGAENIPRLRRFLIEKTRRTRRQHSTAHASSNVPSIDVQCLRELQRFLFPTEVAVESCPTIQCGLQHVLQLENVGGITDVGSELYDLFRTPSGVIALRGYQFEYWTQLRADILALSSARTYSVRQGAVNLEIRVRLQFPDSHAEFNFGRICASVASRHAHAALESSLALAVGRRQMSAVNERVRLFFRERWDRNGFIQ